MESSPAGCRYRPGMSELRATGAITSPPACPQGEIYFPPLRWVRVIRWLNYTLNDRIFCFCFQILAGVTAVPQKLLLKPCGLNMMINSAPKWWIYFWTLPHAHFPICPNGTHTWCASPKFGDLTTV